MNAKEIRDRAQTGKIYFCGNPEIKKEQLECRERLFDYNSLRPGESDKKQALLKEMFAEIGEGCHMEGPLNANWGGKNVHFGKSIYANFNLTLVDDGPIYVGDDVLMGPNVTLATAGHPINPDYRNNGVAQYNLPVRIGNNVWLGAGVVVLPGVTIGENTIIGAGSIVTKDIPANVVAVGNPCKVLREINENDKKYYYKNLEIDINIK